MACFVIGLWAPGLLHAQGERPRFQAGDRIAAPSSVTAAQLRIPEIKAQDIRLFLSADKAYPANHIGLQCQGANDNLSRTPVVRLPNRSRALIGHDDQDDQRFGPTAQGPSGRALRFVVDARDALPEDTPPRCEVFGYPAPETSLPNDSTFWFAVSLWIDDWKNTQDEQIVTQWHQNDPRLSLNPFLAVVVRGHQLRLELRTSLASPATRQDTTTITAVTRSFVPRQWMTLTFKARLAPPGSGRSQLTMWLDDQRIAEHSGDLGFRLADGSFAYAKAGIYKWRNGNPWNTSEPTRSVALGRMLLVADPGETYTLDVIRKATEIQ